MAGKIYLPASENPINPPPAGSFILFIDSTGQYKKMAYDGTITNLTAQSLQDMTDINLTSLQDGQFLKYDSTSGKWINAESSVDITPDDLDDTDSDNKFATQAQLNQIATNESNITTLETELDTAEENIATNTSNISSNNSEITGNSATLLTNSAAIETNSTNISTNSGNIS